jgi:histidyl-tRNA synthetase
MDAEVISLAWRVLSVIGVTGLELHINSIGCPECRGEYNKKLKEYFYRHIDRMCPTCKDRLERNPLRIIDCKEEGCAAIVKDAPKIIDSLCGECAAHFEALKENLDAIGLTYQIDPYIVRGLDYYTRTVFEIIADLPVGRLTVCGGGRYDGLCAQLDGPQTAGIGFGMGMERLIMVIEQCGISVPVPSVTDLYLATLGDAARLEAMRLVARLREDGVKADCDHVGRSLKAQMKYANKLGCAFVAVLGEDELRAGQANVRDMKNASEQSVPFDGIAAYIKERVG